MLRFPSDGSRWKSRNARSQLEDKKKQINSMIQILDNGFKLQMPYLVGMFGEDKKHGYVLEREYLDAFDYFHFCACWTRGNWRGLYGLAVAKGIEAPLVWHSWGVCKIYCVNSKTH
jgi:hypothetical protein